MKQVKIIVAFLCLFLYSAAFASSESVAEKSNQLREKILQKDQQRREQILKKFTDFQNRVKNFAPDFKMKIPVDPSIAEDVKEQDHDSALKKSRSYKAYAADSYKLKSLPYDSEKEVTASVNRGDTLEILMKPVVEKRKDKPSITKDWLLVKTRDGAEGYIPLNMVLNGKPKPARKKNSMADEYDYLIVSSEIDLPEMNEGADIPVLRFAQYGDNSGAQATGKKKVNTATLKVRSDASLNADVVGYLNKNDEVTVEEYSSHEDTYQGKTSKWAKITSDSVSGWVFAVYLSDPGDAPDGGAAANEPAEYLKKGKELFVKPDILRVRDAPDEMGTVLFSLQNKDSVKVVDVEEGAVTLGGKKSLWVKVKFLEYEGWAFGAFLSDNKNAFEEGDDINNIFQVPITDDSYFVSSKFGKRILKGKVSNHTGIDLAASCGTPVSASADGTVISAVTDGRNCSTCGYGSNVIIEHKNGYRTVYGHLTTVKATVGQKVNSGEKIGTVGNTGHSYGCHLHFEVRAYEEFVDPMNYIHP